MYFKKVPSALPIPNSSLSGRMLSEAISKKMLGSIGSLRHRAEQYDHEHDSRWIHTLISLQQKPFLLHHESILIQTLGFHVVGDIKTLNYES